MQDIRTDFLFYSTYILISKYLVLLFPKYFIIDIV